MNALRRLLDEYGISPEELGNAADSENYFAGLQQSPMPQPRYDIAPMVPNTMRTESGPDEGRVVSLDFRGGTGGMDMQSLMNALKAQQQPSVASGYPDQVSRTADRMQPAQAPAWVNQFTGQQSQAPRQMKVYGSGNGTTVQLSPEEAGPVALDRTRGPVDIPGVGRAIYGRDGNAYVLGPDGQPAAKVLLGYDMAGSMALNKDAQERRAREADIARTNAQTAEIGAPNFQLTPNGDVFNPKTGRVDFQGSQPGQVERKQREAAFSLGMKDVTKDEGQVAGMAQLDRALQRWEELQPSVTTGRLMGRIPAVMQPDRQELEQLQSYLSMNNFKPGQGQMSNMERGLIKAGGPNVLNDPETNLDAIKIMRGGVQNTKDRANFRETYLQAKGSLLGAEKAWQDYLDANPRYMQDPQTNRIVDNPARVDWQTYFSQGGTRATSAGAPAVGTVRRGYRFKGGDPSQPSSWERP